MKHTIALLGNPNVGKSSVFNTLTGMHQHTGNWPGKTVAHTSGTFSLGNDRCEIVDLPGISSFHTHSEEEEVTKEFIIGGNYDILLAIADSCALERGLYLLKQAREVMEASGRKSPLTIILGVSLMDEADARGIRIDFPLLSSMLGIPVVPMTGRTKKGVKALRELLSSETLPVISTEDLPEIHPQEVVKKCVLCTAEDIHARDKKIDRILTGPVTGPLIMCLLLTGIFWFTIYGAAAPSAFLKDLLISLEGKLLAVASALHAPSWFSEIFISGVYDVIALVVSVMFPPMAIFFPLFTLLEDLGYLPRVAYNMDNAFEKCHACGKQCLTMAMGLGCNAAGVVGCRIIGSPRERLIAILTNSLIPCNGRFPLLLLSSSLCLSSASSLAGENVPNGLAALFSAASLTLFLAAGTGLTLLFSRILSATLLKGMPSSFTLEMPPYRRPQVGKILVRSLLDRTIFVLGRAILVAAPAGLIIWIMENITLGGVSLLACCSHFLDPLGHLMGLDGIILMGFLLGLPANEIVLPIILMVYLNNGNLVMIEDAASLISILSSHGWTARTAVCMGIFSLFHWPCSTTLLTIRKETGSRFWTMAAFLIPTLSGILLCILASIIFS